MDAPKNLLHGPRFKYLVTGALAVVISIGLWQMYGSWLMSAAGEYGS